MYYRGLTSSSKPEVQKYGGAFCNVPLNVEWVSFEGVKYASVGGLWRYDLVTDCELPLSQEGILLCVLHSVYTSKDLDYILSHLHCEGDSKVEAYKMFLRKIESDILVSGIIQKK